MDPEVSSPSSVVVSYSGPQNSMSNLAAKQRDGRRSSSTTPPFLSNLGRATLRGIRKCPQCGVYNGTRGLSCKNKACGISLRTASEGGRSRKAGAVEVVKVITDSIERDGKEADGEVRSVQVFSVCHRERGVSQLGFVQLVPTDTAIATGDGATLLTLINLGRCLLPTCKRAQRSSQPESAAATSKQSANSICIHIKKAIECRANATPLTLKSSVLEGLHVSFEDKDLLWRLATESPGPLVQRVSKDTLVVKCQTDSQHPLGLLHLTVGASSLPEAGKSREVRHQQEVFKCSCQGTAGSPADAADVLRVNGATLPHCLHFYACVCALKSDDTLAKEFAAFINYSPAGVQQNLVCSASGEKPLQRPHQKLKRSRLEDGLAGSPPQEGASASGVRKAGQRRAAPELKAADGSHVVDEHALTMSFHQWLACVTERIHHTMHYQSDGKPDPLVFFIPQEFFSALQHRLSLGSKKRRLPNSTTALVGADGLPGSSRYTWHISSLKQVKQIFDTPELPLEFIQSFVRNADGSFSRFRCLDAPAEPPSEQHRPDRPHTIRPMELRTLLKVGPSADNSSENTPFVIEWIPDVLPRCHMGELRLSFEFQHLQSGPSDPDRPSSGVKSESK
ncbi:uncharacterized protein C2orf42 homolog isoform 1-T2 [Synchiropus picturatus]